LNYRFWCGVEDFHELANFRAMQSKPDRHYHEVVDANYEINAKRTESPDHLETILNHHPNLLFLHLWANQNPVILQSSLPHPHRTALDTVLASKRT